MNERGQQSLSALWAWQKEVYLAAIKWQCHLFTMEGIKELAAKLQKQADGLKGKEREVRLCFYYNDLNPYLSIGPNCHVSFTKVKGSWASMAETEGKVVELGETYKELTISVEGKELNEALQPLEVKDGDTVRLIIIREDAR